MLAMILLAFIAVVGPLDFLVINRVLGRPLLGWLTFPLVAIGLSVVLALEARPRQSTSPSTQWDLSTKTTAQTVDAAGGSSEPIDDVGCNRIEIFDIDANANVGRGFTAEYLYSHDARSYDVRFKPSSSLESLSTPSMNVAPGNWKNEVPSYLT